MPSTTMLLERCENVAVLRTLSKAHALAAARIGTLIAAPDVIALLRRIQAPYPLPQLCIDAALAACTLQALQETAARVDDLVRERERVAPLLRRLPGVREVFDSSANFVCVRFADAGAAYRHLLHGGVIVRDVSYQYGLEQCLRITIGTTAENNRMLAALSASEAAA
jgi:histidinol-phosphate aminotransferase